MNGWHAPRGITVRRVALCAAAAILLLATGCYRAAASVEVPSPAVGAPKDAGEENPAESPPPSSEAVSGTEPPPSVSRPGEEKAGKELVSGAGKAGGAVPTTTAATRG